MLSHRIAPIATVAAALAFGAPATAQEARTQSLPICIPTCVCVVAEGCPCCNSSWPIQIRSDNAGVNDRLARLLHEFRTADPRAFAADRQELVASLDSGDEDDQAAAYAALALTNLPARQAESFGISAPPQDQIGAEASPADYAAYAVCWYARLAAGDGAVSAGNHCRAQYLN